MVASVVKRLPVPIEVVGRFQKQGQGAVLFSGRIGQEHWVVKVPNPSKPVVARSLSVRELIYGRFAERLGLPVAALEVVTVTSTSRGRVDVPTHQDAFTATLRLDLGPCVQAWAELLPRDRAALALWENATAIGTGEKIRSSRPRDFFRRATVRDGEPPYVMLDYESVENVWELATSGGGIREDVPPCTDSRACVQGLLPALLAETKEDALACLEGGTWDDMVRDADAFHTGDLEPLRRAMRNRIEGAWMQLGVGS